jgi:acyl transferase domain-containing protein
MPKLEDIIERELEMEIVHGEEDGEKNRKLEKDKKTAEEMGIQSLETFSETRKRKAENSEEDDENPKPKKTRQSGSATLLYLQEKSQMDMEFKKEELQLKKEKQAKQFEEQMAMRQQRSELLKSFTDVQQSMQSQMQAQAELQQQQMQQNNQMMMQMIQNMKKKLDKTVSNRSGIYLKPNVHNIFLFTCCTYYVTMLIHFN